MQLIDSHCHLDFPQFDTDRSQVLAQCHQQGIEKIVLAAISRKPWSRLWRTLDVSVQPQLYGTFGLHPYFLAEHQPDDLELLRQQLSKHQHHPRLCALGEIGLDFHLRELDRQQQVFYFTQQLQLAKDFDLPVIIHARKSHAAVIQQLKHYALPRGGIIHAFNGSYELAQEYIKLGFLLGIGGAYTYANARRLRALLPRLPLSSLSLETDSPDMAPAFAAGQRNTPSNLAQICTELAQLIGIPATQLARQTTHNTKKLFAWDSH